MEEKYSRGHGVHYFFVSKIIDVYKEKVPHSIKYQEKYRHVYYIDLIYSK